jgi:hypothetical protein
MPIQRCQKNGKPGFKWGKSGKCYIYTPNNKASRERARQRALQQARAIQANRGD